jgi:hypothetical protein
LLISSLIVLAKHELAISISISADSSGIFIAILAGQPVSKADIVAEAAILSRLVTPQVGSCTVVINRVGRPAIPAEQIELPAMLIIDIRIGHLIQTFNFDNFHLSILLLLF